jgi:hypothetical protein
LYSWYGNSILVTQKVKNTVVIWTRHSSSEYLLKNIKRSISKTSSHSSSWHHYNSLSKEVT